MKLFKRIDLWGQLALIGVILIDYCITLNPGFGYYLLVGSWQLLSCFVHLILPGHFYHSPQRRYYYIGLLIVGILSIFMLAFPLNYLTGISKIALSLQYLTGIMVVTSLFACWYIYISYQENVLITRKEFIHLK